MVRSLSDYSFADWRRLRPLIHGLKTAKYRLATKRYVRRPASAGDLSALARSMAGKRVLVTIAFGDDELVDWQVRLVRHYVPSTKHVIADNSRDDGAAARIAAICTEFDAPYVRLPANPWHQPSRSHGIALNWIWCNLIRPGEPGPLDFSIMMCSLRLPTIRSRRYPARIASGWFAPLDRAGSYGRVSAYSDSTASRTPRLISGRTGFMASIPAAATGAPSTNILSGQP